MENREQTHKDDQWAVIIVWISVRQFGSSRSVCRRHWNVHYLTEGPVKLFKESRHQRYER
jgi:hypothetical protein